MEDVDHAYYLLCLFHLKMSNHYTKITARGKEKKAHLLERLQDFSLFLLLPSMHGKHL